MPVRPESLECRVIPERVDLKEIKAKAVTPVKLELLVLTDSTV